MSPMISLCHSLQLLTFVSILPLYDTTTPALKLAFLNGLNILRCSDKKVRVYQGTDVVLTPPLTCDDSNASDQINFTWEDFRIDCTDDDTVFEQQDIHVESSGVQDLRSRNVIAQRWPSDEFLSDVRHIDDDNLYVLIFKEQSIKDVYFKKAEDARKIYISFPACSTICRISIPYEASGPCPADNPTVENMRYVCYYNPGSEVATIDKMEAEIQQVEDAKKPDGQNPYELDLDKPTGDGSGGAESTGDKSGTPSSGKSKENGTTPVKPAPQPSKSTKSKPKPVRVIVIIVGVLILIVVVGAGMYLGRQHFMKGSRVTDGEQKGRKGSESVGPNESQQSLSTMASDANTEMSINDASRKDKPTIKLQANEANKRQRTGTSMVFNGDV